MRLKKWVEKLIQQFDFDSQEPGNPAAGNQPKGISDEHATLLFIIDTFNKHLVEIENHPVRKTREILDEYAKELLNPEGKDLDRILFRFRQFFQGYRIDETAYMQKTFDDFRVIIWDFVDQLAEDISDERKDDSEIKQSLDELKEAVEANSIDELKNQSRKFIDCYVEKQFKKDKRRQSRMKSIQKNLSSVKKQLVEAHDSAKVDHLTQAHNRKAFEEFCSQQLKFQQMNPAPLCLLLVDIDHFKRINDSYGHDMGDFVLKELVATLKKTFSRNDDLVCRFGGEEFAIVLPEMKMEEAVKTAGALMDKIRADVIVHEKEQIRFTISIGAAEYIPGESIEAWTKRADLALYHSKNTGRDRLTVAPTSAAKAA